MTNERKTRTKHWSIVGIVALVLGAFTSLMSFVNAFTTDQRALWISVGFVFAGATVFAFCWWTKRT